MSPVHVIRQRPTAELVRRMLEPLETYIKLAVDIERGVLAGGGTLHADAEEALLEDGSRQEDVWGADWYPEERRVAFESIINIRPRQNNASRELLSPKLRSCVEAVVRGLLEGV